MISSELRIGNKIGKDLRKSPENVFTVASVGEHSVCVLDGAFGTYRLYFEYGEIEGIPITEERLVENGFIDIGEHIPEQKGFYSFAVSGTQHLLYKEGKWEIMYNYNGAVIPAPCPQLKYIHQLQNLCFCLSDKELND